jgi:hypothetical protein
LPLFQLVTLTPTASVQVDDLRPVQFRDRAFKRLVIKDEYKKLIIAMVEAYMLEQPGFSVLLIALKAAVELSSSRT